MHFWSPRKCLTRFRHYLNPPPQLPFSTPTGDWKRMWVPRGPEPVHPWLFAASRPHPGTGGGGQQGQRHSLEVIPLAGWKKANRVKTFDRQSWRCLPSGDPVGPDVRGWSATGRAPLRFRVSSCFLWEPWRHGLPKAASEVACEAFVLGGRGISAPVAPNKGCINSRPVRSARATKPNTVSQPSDKLGNKRRQDFAE